MKSLSLIDRIDDLNLKTDSSLEIMRECGRQGIETYFCEDKDLMYENGEGYAVSTEVNIGEENYVKGRRKILGITEFDFILIRKEPPYDMNYHYATMLLDNLGVKSYNFARGLRNNNEKLIALNFSELTPDTLVTKRKKMVYEFLNKYNEAVLKPVDLFGGQGLYKLKKGEDGIKGRIDSMKGQYMIIQEFLPSVYENDKRVLLLNGEPLGALGRIPKEGDFRANLAAGGRAVSTEITKNDIKIIERIKPYLVKEGLSFAGIDIVGDKLLEINITCPTGIMPVKEFTGKNITKDIVDFFKNDCKNI